MIYLSLNLEVIATTVRNNLIIGVIADNLFVDTSTSHSKYAKLPNKERVNVSLNDLCTIQVNSGCTCCA